MINIILSSSQTMNIDGETNLKYRSVPEGFNQVINGDSAEDIQRKLNQTNLQITCEQPRAHIYKFEGVQVCYCDDNVD